MTGHRRVSTFPMLCSAMSLVAFQEWTSDTRACPSLPLSSLQGGWVGGVRCTPTHLRASRPGLRSAVTGNDRHLLPTAPWLEIRGQGTVWSGPAEDSSPDLQKATLSLRPPMVGSQGANAPRGAPHPIPFHWGQAFSIRMCGTQHSVPDTCLGHFIARGTPGTLRGSQTLRTSAQKLPIHKIGTTPTTADGDTQL